MQALDSQIASSYIPGTLNCVINFVLHIRDRAYFTSLFCCLYVVLFAFLLHTRLISKMENSARNFSCNKRLESWNEFFLISQFIRHSARSAKKNIWIELILRWVIATINKIIMIIKNWKYFLYSFKHWFLKAEKCWKTVHMDVFCIFFWWNNKIIHVALT